MILKTKRTKPNAILPKRAKPGDSGLDLHLCMPEGRGTLVLNGNQSLCVDTGIAIELPEGYEAQVRPRSGLARKQGVVAVLGTIDNGYRGEIGVTLLNHSKHQVWLGHGDRIAQLVVAPVALPDVVEVTELTETERGSSGFGSTGV